MGERGNGDPFAMKERLRPDRPPAQGRDAGTPGQPSTSGAELGTQGRVVTHCSWSPPSRAPARRSSARHRPAPPAAAAERFRGRPARRPWARTGARAAAISYRGGALRAAPPCPPGARLWRVPAAASRVLWGTRRTAVAAAGLPGRRNPIPALVLWAVVRCHGRGPRPESQKCFTSTSKEGGMGLCLGDTRRIVENC